jgi:hypothetical protein
MDQRTLSARYTIALDAKKKTTSSEKGKRQSRPRRGKGRQTDNEHYGHTGSET